LTFWSATKANYNVAEIQLGNYYALKLAAPSRYHFEGARKFQIAPAPMPGR